MCAASAPANPDAPTTATLCTEPPPERLEARLDRRAQARHLLVGEGPVGRAELEPERERLLALADLLAAVDVEQACLREELAAADLHRGLHLGGRHLLRDHHRDVLEH